LAVEEASRAAISASSDASSVYRDCKSEVVLLAVIVAEVVVDAEGAVGDSCSGSVSGVIRGAIVEGDGDAEVCRSI
jgi:hypothetical protein